MGSILVPKTTSKSYFWISFEKRRFTKSLGIPNEIKHFFKTKSSLISFKSLTSLKTALKNYTWKVCVLPQQNAFGRPFSLKKHEEMFCDFAKTSGFFGESRHTKCISFGEMHIHDFSLNRKQADFSKQNSDHLAPREFEDWLKILHDLVQFRVLKSMLKAEGVEFIYSAVAQHKLEGFGPCRGGNRRGQQSPHAWRPCPRTRGRRIKRPADAGGSKVGCDLSK